MGTKTNAYELMWVSALGTEDNNKLLVRLRGIYDWELEFQNIYKAF